MTRIAVIDHGAGNLVSISQALARCGGEADIVTKPDRLAAYDGIVLPGVGSTAAVMEGIEQAGFAPALRQLDRPLLGICVGLQVLFDGSEEDGAECLGIISGQVHPLAHAPSLPHIGWNDLEVVGGSPMFAGIDAPVVYFVHSYAPVPRDAGVITATARHGQTFVAAVAAGRVWGVQFHPERSGETGLRILHRFVDSCGRATDAA